MDAPTQLSSGKSFAERLRDRLAERGHAPLWIHLRDEIARAIADGAVRPGARMPGERALAAELGVSRVTLRRAPAWTTEWISAEGRRKLHAYGIAPPGPVEPDAGDAAAVPIRIRPRGVDCPRCGSAQTERLSAFGSTACKALYRCLACREPFEHFKPI